MIKAHNPNNLPTIDYRDLIELQPNSFKDLSEKNFDKLSNSFNVHGFITPYFVWKDKGKYFILDGHQRSRVLSTLEPNGLEVPYILIEAKNKQEAAKKLLAIDSRYGKRTAEGEQEFLDIFEIEQGYIEDVAVLEFEFEEAEEEIEAEEDDFDVPQGGFKTDIVLGDLFEIGEHRLLCGDSTCGDTVAKLMNGAKADMVFTDPPYNISFSGSMSNTTKDGVMVKHKGANQQHDVIKNDAMTDKDFYDFISDTLKEIKINCIGAFYICFGSQTLNQLLQPFLDLGLEYKSIIIWMKNQATLSGKDYKGRYEPIVYGRFNDGFYGERFKQEDIWEFQRTLKNDLHPTMKPIPLIENAINNSSKIGMKVLDLFLGSGSTMVAAHQLKRKCYGLELDPKYCDVIVRRMVQLDINIIVKRNGIDETEKWLSKINEASDEEE